MSKVKLQLIIVMICTVMMGTFSVVNAAESKTEGQVMLIAAPGGLVYAAGVEFGGSSNMSFAVRAGGFSYEYTDSSYYEEGSGTIAGVTGRFYSMKAMEGMFFGAGVDLVSGKTYWRDYPLYGNSTYSGISPHAVVGYKIRSGNMSFEPNFYAAVIPGGKQVSAVVGIGLTVGMRF